MTQFDLETFLPYKLAISAEKISQAFSQHYFAAYGINRAEWRILCHLACSEEALSIRDLEKRAHLEKSKVSRAVTRLENIGLVTKSTHHSDTRLLSILLTEKGLHVFENIEKIAVQFQEALKNLLGDQQMDTLFQQLDILYSQALEELSEDT